MKVDVEAAKLRTMLLDQSVPFAKRKQLLMHVLMSGNDEHEAVVASIVEGASTPKDQRSVYAEKAKEMAELMQQMQAGPLRTGTFLRKLKTPRAKSRAEVLLQDGQTAFVTVPNDRLMGSLRCGDNVLIEPNGKAVLFRDTQAASAGEEARYERQLGPGLVEVTIREAERLVFRLSAQLTDKIESGQVEPGRNLLVCSRRMIAFDAIPVEDGFAAYRFLSRHPVPDIVVERDLASPPAYIQELVDLVELTMERGERYGAWRLPRCALKLLAGVSGSGKTYSIMALWRRIYEVIARRTGVPMEQLPPRVMRLRSSEVLSKWFGESDKNFERFFDEAERLASEPFVAPNGKSYELPVLCILEEIDGMARTRGNDALYDRILSTPLRRLDTTQPRLRDKFILFVATTNVDEQIDSAFLRRIGGTIERFRRLDRYGFAAVLEKHLAQRPLARAEALGQDAARQHIVADLVGWMFCPKDEDEAQAEITFAGSVAPVKKYRRDFLTAGLIDRAVVHACVEAMRWEYHEDTEVGLSTERLIASLDRQVRATVEQLHEANVHSYVDIEDGVRIASVRRVVQPAMQPYQLIRVA